MFLRTKIYQHVAIVLEDELYFRFSCLVSEVTFHKANERLELFTGA